MQIPVERAKQLFPAAPRGAHVRPSPLSSARLSVPESQVAAGLVPLGILLSMVAGSLGTRGVRPAAHHRQAPFARHPASRMPIALRCSATEPPVTEPSPANAEEPPVTETPPAQAEEAVFAGPAQSRRAVFRLL